MDLSEHTQVAMVTPTVAGREVTLPLSVLFRDPLNVRKKAGKSVEALAALIYSQSLLQNLVVREELVGKGKRLKPSGRYGVVAGGRRLEALLLLLSQRKVSEDYPVRCLLVSQEDALSVSLAENCEREPLHGADLFDAFKAMIDLGKSPAQVAEAWGVSTLTVERRLKLARVSPKLLDLYREDGIELDQLVALALVDDHATQESVWENASTWVRDPASLRRALTAREIEARSPLAIFVGVEAYEQAGGAVRRDLFAEDDGSGVYLCDAPLLERMALERLRERAESLRVSEGLAWAEGRLRFDWQDRRAFQECRVIEADPTPEEQAKLDALEAEIESLEAQWDALGEDEEGESLVERQDELEAQRAAITAGLQKVDPQDQSIAGVVVYLDMRGRMVEAKGLVRPEDREAQEQAGVEGDGGESSEGRSSPGKGKPPKAEFSERLLRQLTAHRTAAIRACLADDPGIALRVLAYQLAAMVFYNHDHAAWKLDRPVQVRAEFSRLESDAPDLAESPAHIEFESRRERLGDDLPGAQEDLMRWMLGRDDTEVMNLIAFCTACTINVVQGRESEQPVADEVAEALQLDMADWWKPSAISYLGAVPKSKVIEAVVEATSAEDAVSLAGMKKDALIASAERKLEGTRWLPKPLRPRTA